MRAPWSSSAASSTARRSSTRTSPRRCRQGDMTVQAVASTSWPSDLISILRGPRPRHSSRNAFTPPVVQGVLSQASAECSRGRVAIRMLDLPIRATQWTPPLRQLVHMRISNASAPKATAASTTQSWIQGQLPRTSGSQRSSLTRSRASRSRIIYVLLCKAARRWRRRANKESRRAAMACGPPGWDFPIGKR